MGSKKSKKTLFHKLRSAFSGDAAATVSEEEKTETTSSAPREEETPDLVFVKNFTDSGGRFLYCENENELHHNLKSILREVGWKHIFCKEEPLKEILQHTQIDHSCEDLKGCDAIFTSCEFLIAFNGGIMISSRQTCGKKIHDLPNAHIVLASVSQLVSKLGEGLRGIREKYKGNIPSLITTIKGPVSSSSGDGFHKEESETKEVYLLLVEDHS